MMDLGNEKTIPKDYFAIRLTDCNIYLHADTEDSELYFKERMHGCIALSYADALMLKHKLMEDLGDYELEIINFHDAYEEHGLIEKQISYN